jgi:hypothetical protein
MGAVMGTKSLMEFIKFSLEIPKLLEVIALLCHKIIIPPLTYYSLLWCPMWQ